MVTVECPTCMFCGKAATVTMTEAEAEAVRTSRFIQDALPEWRPEARELLISGTHPACWAEMLPPEED